MDNTTAPRTPKRSTLHTANAALWAQHDRANALAAALDSIRTWRHAQPHGSALDFAPLDAILDAAALGDGAPLQRLGCSTRLPEAVAAHRAVMDARRQALAATVFVWDQIEAAAIREIDRHLPPGKSGDVRP